MRTRQILHQYPYNWFPALRAGYAERPCPQPPAPPVLHDCVIRNEQDAEIYMNALESVLFERAEL